MSLCLHTEEMTYLQVVRNKHHKIIQNPKNNFTHGRSQQRNSTEWFYSIYLGRFPQFGVVADNSKKTTKHRGLYSVLLAMMRDPAEFGWHCWSNTAHPPPSSTTYVASWMPSPLLPLPQGCLYKATPWQQQMPIKTASQSLATHSYSQNAHL